MSHKSIKLAAAIVNRGAGNRAAAIFHTYNHEILLAVRGHGTASSAVMDCLGLDEPEKDLVLGLSSKTDVYKRQDTASHGITSQKGLHNYG